MRLVASDNSYDLPYELISLCIKDAPQWIGDESIPTCEIQATFNNKSYTIGLFASANDAKNQIKAIVEDYANGHSFCHVNMEYTHHLEELKQKATKKVQEQIAQLSFR